MTVTEPETRALTAASLVAVDLSGSRWMASIPGWMDAAMQPCPHCGYVAAPYAMVLHLNDMHQVDREETARLFREMFPDLEVFAKYMEIGADVTKPKTGSLFVWCRGEVHACAIGAAFIGAYLHGEF